APFPYTTLFRSGPRHPPRRAPRADHTGRGRAVRYHGRDGHRGADDPHPQPRGVPRARPAVLHAHRDGRGVPAHVPSPDRDRWIALGEVHALRAGVAPLHLAVASPYLLSWTGDCGTELLVGG